MSERHRARSAAAALGRGHHGKEAGAVVACGANAHVRPPLVSSPRWARANRTRWHRTCLDAARIARLQAIWLRRPEGARDRTSVNELALRALLTTSRLCYVSIGRKEGTAGKVSACPIAILISDARLGARRFVAGGTGTASNT